MKPVLYLDVDGVLWVVRHNVPIIAAGDPRAYAMGAPGLDDFLEFAFQNFEIRWCTTWALTGHMFMETRERLAEHTGVPASTWARVRDSNGWMTYKHENIALEEHRAGRPFVWVEDTLLEEEHQWLRGNGWSDRYFFTDVFADPSALQHTTDRLRIWLKETT